MNTIVLLIKLRLKVKIINGVDLSSEPYFGDIKMIEITEGEHTFLIPERKSQYQIICLY